MSIFSLRKPKIAFDSIPVDYTPYKFLDFDQVEEQAYALADIIRENYDELVNVLLEYESYEVATDEVARTLDILESLEENKNYFNLRIGAVTTFLPRNQPLYALTCFVVIPSLMASEVHFRIPHTMKSFLPKVLDVLNITKLFTNIKISNTERIVFLKERSALRLSEKTKESRPVTDAVIFTGTSQHAEQLRLVFDRRTLFITNGSGHNPIVISKDADINASIEAVLTLSLYNQGQDCAAPNSILVHKDIYDRFIDRLYSKFSRVRVGPYKNHSCRVGPISNPEDLKNIEEIIVNNREWLHKKTSGVIRTAEAIVEPTIICKPLIDGGNYTESFAPLIFIQKYDKDSDLSLYFENQQYAQNAMYVTLYGESVYINSLIGRDIKGKILHHKDTFLHNKHLHEKGVERGTQPYGGYGPGASSISIFGKVTSMPTLPQRDISDWIAKPLIEKNLVNNFEEIQKEFTVIENKNVEKILRLKSQKNEMQDQTRLSDNTYIDLTAIKHNELRFVKIEENNMYHILNKPNIEYIAGLEVNELKLISALKNLLSRKNEISFEDFVSLLYSIPKEINSTEIDNSNRQLRFFQNIYQLLLKKNSGPKLAPFLWELDVDILDNLLDV
jgi:hypothetical protein